MFPDRSSVRVAAAALFLVLTAAAPLAAAHILIWDNDRDATVFIRSRRQMAGTEVPVREALETAGYEVTVVRTLPDDLERFDAVFILLGFFCPM
ncbi:hypothetical protein JXO52_08105 [bacterium]|nr:hypothetical protein [bacterium]